ncbi:hypothetical protein KVR01_000384 [Diaporthe batatas]|uniref:uncharacterized protein n=1 Tax=Diaporthe batatas TaxID=748121 RepID=UPI001D04BD15|nr:uncharacterized protein KVR01_000384 [Diaporthe batatas]KAG8169639.1 hypothetical protein KVR01_000384 [Diaporthe batatas]
MKPSRYARSRQKACQNCSTAKARCDRRPQLCGRCAQRGLNCAYLREPVRTPAASVDGSRHSDNTITPSAGRSPLPGASSGHLTSTTPGGPTVISSEAPVSPPQPLRPPQPAPAAPAAPNDQDSTPDSTSARVDKDLVCPINADYISSRWLNQYVPVPGQTVKDFPGHIKAFMPRILGSYASMAVRGRQLPPFIHPAQMHPPLARPPLSTCLSLVRICERLLPGSDTTAADVMQREASSIFEQHAAMTDGITLLSAFQAHLLYLLVMFSKLGHLVGHSMRRMMMDLQELASLCSKRGLVCVAEQNRARPSWESWVVAEAKRRTLYTMYLFDNMLSTHEGLPSFFGTELKGLPAPSSRSLWEAKTPQDWEGEYNNDLADWAGPGLSIDELWPAPSWLDVAGLAERRKRVDQWLEGVDGMGTMLFAITSSLHNV